MSRARDGHGRHSAIPLQTQLNLGKTDRASVGGPDACDCCWLEIGGMEDRSGQGPYGVALKSHERKEN